MTKDLKIPRKNLTNQKFGRLTVISFVGRDRLSRQLWRCRCDCGQEKTVMVWKLKYGKITSCGCRKTEKATKHGCSRTAEYNAWAHMIQRCVNPNCKAYPYYGGRGISVCDRWRNSFEAFLTDMGRKPSPRHSLERNDNNQGYYPDNCRWATKREQMKNRRRWKWGGRFTKSSGKCNRSRYH